MNKKMQELRDKDACRAQLEPIIAELVGALENVWHQGVCAGDLKEQVRESLAKVKAALGEK